MKDADMNGLRPNEVVTLLVERSSALNTLWTLYAGVVAAVLTALATGKVSGSSLGVQCAITTGFAVFSLFNLLAIVSLGRLRSGLMDMLPRDFAGRALFVDTLAPARTWQYATFHLVLDVCLVICVWFIPWKA